jgi:hypothetical protein
MRQMGLYTMPFMPMALQDTVSQISSKVPTPPVEGMEEVVEED